MSIRSDNRLATDIRNIEIVTDTNPYAEGSCIISFGNTKVHCTGTLEATVPHFLRNSNTGWITAEYGMLPRSTHDRISRKKSQEAGRTKEIQRLIGRSLRTAVNLTELASYSIIIDCDVLQADGGTRTASVTGGYVALCLVLQHMQRQKMITTDPLKNQVAAISCGIVDDTCLVDLDYNEDSQAQADANFVMSENGLIEVQCTAEKDPISNDNFQELLSLAEVACKQIMTVQKSVL